MPKFKPCDYKQSTMITLNYEDQLQSGTFEYAIHYLISKKLDLSIFHPHYENDETGRPAYDPAILLKIILFAYSKGITSSREIQWCCETNIIFKALSCDTVPHFTTIASFVSSHTKEIEQLFEQILLICDQQGLLGHELFAIDGCKLPSNAAKEWSGTFKELEQKRDKLKRQIHHYLNEQQRHDKNETQENTRQQRTQQTINTLNQAHDKIEQFLKQSSPRRGQGKTKKEVKSNITDNESAKMTTSKGTIQGYNGVASVDKKHQIIIDAQAFGEGQEHHVLKPVLEKIKTRYKKLGIHNNIYDKTIVTADTGYANEANMKYCHQNKINAYIPDNKFRQRDPKFKTQHGKYGKRAQSVDTHTGSLIPSSEFHFDPINKTCTCPMNQPMQPRGERQDRYENYKLYFEGHPNQCRQCELKPKCMRTPSSANHRKGHGRQVSFIIEKKHRKTNYTDWMKHRVDSQKGKQIYSHRMSVVEPVFGNLTNNKKLNRFSLRSKEKVQAQWQLYCLVHNIEKLNHYSKLFH